MAKPKKLPIDKKKAQFLDQVRYYTTFMSLVLLNLNVFGFSLKKVCSPGFNCHGCAWATSACPIGVFAHGFSVRQIPYLALGTILAFGVVLGRLVCAYACPFGLFQDFMFRIPSITFKIPRCFRYLKYLALALLVVALPLAYGLKHAGFMKVVPDKNTLTPQGAVITVENLGDQPIVAPIIELAYVPNSPKSGADLQDSSTAAATTDDLTEGVDEQGLPTAKKVFRDVVIDPKQTLKLPMIPFPNRTSEGLLEIKVYSADNPKNIPIPNPKIQAYYCLHCPAGALTASLPKALTSTFGDGDGGTATDEVEGGEFYAASLLEYKFAILLVFLILMVITSRPFCQTFCPLGAIYALCSPLALSRMRLDKSACGGCALCDRVCPMDLDVRKEVGGMECIVCGNCQKMCPKSAVTREFGFGFGTKSVTAEANAD